MRTKVRKTLLEFGERVDAVLTTEKSKQKKIAFKGMRVKITKNAKLYASGVRASSDLNARKRREECLEKELKKNSGLFK
jgi:hypothetical protein